MTNKKDTRQLLVEKAEFRSKINIPETLKESLQMNTTKVGTLIVKNIPSTILNRVNQNGRIYSTEVVQAALDEAKRLHLFEQKNLLSQADEHPDSSFVAPSHASHVVINAYIKPNVRIVVEGKEEQHDVLFMDWEILNTQEGKNLRALFEAECSVGVSIRGVGSMNGKYVEDYQLCGADCVGLPSSSTYTRMQVSESAKLEVAEGKDDLKETFTVSTSSTNVVRDLDAAAALYQRLNSANYGTVTKTSTKVDEETDPKTGAQTSLTTLEAETSDDVADLDQALTMARNAMLNGIVNVDSITIENVKEEEPKESVEENNTTLSEENSMLSEDDIKQALLSGKKVCPNGNLAYQVILDKNNKLKLKAATGQIVPLTPDFVDMKSLKIVEAVSEATEKDKDTEDKLKGKKFVLKTPNGFVSMDGNTLVFTEDPKEALHFIVGKEESGLVHLSGVEKILDAMGVFDVEKYYRKDLVDTKDTSKKESNLLDGTPANPIQGQPQVNANLKEDNGSNTRYIAQVSIKNPNGNLETDTIPVSGVEQEAILNEVSNLWRQKNESSKGEVRIVVVDTQDNHKFLYNPSNNSLQAFDDQGAISDTFPREFTQEESVEPVEQNQNKLTVNVDDNTSIEKEFDSNAQAAVVKAGLEKGEIPGDVMLEDSRYVLEFDFKRDSSGVVPYDLYFKGNSDETIDLLLQDLKKLKDNRLIWNYYLEDDFVIINGLNEGEVNTLLNSLRKNGFKILSKDFPELHKLDEAESQEGWYVGAEGIGISGPYKSREEAMSGLEPYSDIVSVEYISNSDMNEASADFFTYDKPELYFNNILNNNNVSENDKNFIKDLFIKYKNEEVSPLFVMDVCQRTLNKINDNEISEQLYSNAGEPSDDFVEKPINEADEKVRIILTNIDWDVESIVNSFKSNAQDDDIATMGDLESLIRDLPNELEVEIDANSFNSDDADEIKSMILDQAGNKVGMRIKNAKISSID